MVLASRSPYFKAMFCGDCKEAKENRLEMKADFVSADIFKRILEIIYNGCMTDNSPWTYDLTIEKNTGQTYHKDMFTNLDDGVSHLVFKKFWNFANEILLVADFFIVTELVLLSLQKEISANHCRMSNCGFCLNLYMFAFEKKMPILDKFPRFDRDQYKIWDGLVYKTEPKLIPVPFKFDSNRLSILFDKFS